MIRTEKEYTEALKRIEEDEEFLEEQRKNLEEKGLTPEQIKKLIDPTISFNQQLIEEVNYYEQIRRGNFNPILNMHNLGKTLIAYRIYLGISQKDLAERLNVSPAQVSRDEKNEYYGATLERLQRVMNAMHMTVESDVKNTDKGSSLEIV
ncbi:Helix-turn-helix [Marinococcus luteus]|uniref:Helix-turn-helix n=1 Tax=Marinococcus luteus TaxID=1122204 RepID=A0A1H2YAK8_9BACI|nr:helix-turn-helix transcriptional regulator [Marinococcus luteus]SDX02005.1 Helix-turn-helix [Marinococcus luteus]